ncbi:MAG: DUF4169 family protein [Parvularculaceae bacterium]|nr:DUF4169 family protein [Parvularculaceae bacterium]
MADIVNLNRARKKKRAAKKEKSAAANRAKFGRTKAEKSLENAKREKLNRLIDEHRLDED